MNIHYFQHVPFEKLGIIEKWIIQNKHNLNSTKFYEKYTLPTIESIDFLIVMGGPMGVNDNEKYPWLKLEKEFIKKAIESNKKVLGICLGSQLIAQVLGAEVYPNKEKEIGWWEVKLTKSGKKHIFFKDLPENFTTFHWHGDTFDLPENTEHLIFSEICQNQAFVFENRVVGLQFHFEMTEDTLQGMIENVGEELEENGKYISSKEEVINNLFYVNKNQEMIFQFLDIFANE